MQGVSILGSTGSIGRQALQVLKEQKEDFLVKALVAGSNSPLLYEQVKEFSPSLAVVVNETRGEELHYLLQDESTRVLTGEEGLLAAATLEGVDLVLNAVVGVAGLKPTLAAIQAGKHIALANKETLVSGGSLVMPLVKETGVQLLPVDSEHSAVFQLLASEKRDALSRIILTASGGPFRQYKRGDLERVTPEDALQHPTWEMGGKVTIDSATMMNKGLEVIEAHWLFEVPYDKIEVLIHPQSIVHSLVEFKDHTIFAQMGLPDMKGPIQYALNYPRRMKNNLAPLHLEDVSSLSFFPVDGDLFPCLHLAYQAGRAGGSAPVILNAANEVLVAAFLKRQLPLPKIPSVIEEILASHSPVQLRDVEDVDYWDAWAREKVIEELGGDI